MTLLPKFWERKFLLCEFILALALALMFAIWYFYFDGASDVDRTLRGNRAALYGTVASISGSLLGFVITAVSIVLGFSASERLAVVRQSKEYSTLWETFSATIKALALSTVVALACLIFDRDDSSRSQIMVLLVFSVLLSLLRLSRAIWVLENIISLVTRPPSTGT